MITASLLRARELLAKPKEELYDFYITHIASDYVKAKTLRGKKASFRMWVANLERDSVEV